MSVSPVNQTGNVIIPTLTPVPPAPENISDEEVVQTTEVDETAEQTPVAATEAEGADDNSGKTRGVIRNLMAGHFKGVADVRLRINFYDEISAMEQAQAAQVAEEGVSNILNTVNSEIESFLQTEELDEELTAALAEAQNVFTTSIPQALDNFVSEGVSGAGGLIPQLQSTFDEFVTSLNAVLAAPEESSSEEPDEIEPPVDTEENGPVLTATVIGEQEELTEEPQPSPIQQFVDKLIETFSSELAELEAALSQIQVLPELSEPSGNGVAYDKFLAIYNEMRGITGTEPQPGAIDTIT